jgi:hypothetical protein
MINQNFVFLGAALQIIGGFSYLIATLQGKAKPNRVSWFMWALAPLITFAAELKSGIGIIALSTFFAGFNPLLIFIASFVNKKSSWKLQPFDFVCGFFSIVGLVLWIVTKQPNLAIIFSIIADGMASLPTIIKSYTHPESEDIKVYVFAGISAFITLLTAKAFTWAYIGFPLYLLLDCAIIAVLVKFKIGKKINKK